MTTKKPDLIFVVGGCAEIRREQMEYVSKKQLWDYECQNIRDSFMHKTSRVKSGKAGNIKEYENWYRTGSDGYLKIVGKTEPVYEDYFSKEPKKPVIPDHEEEGNHLIMKMKNFDNFKTLFKKCRCFPMESLITGKSTAKKRLSKNEKLTDGEAK